MMHDLIYLEVTILFHPLEQKIFLDLRYSPMKKAVLFADQYAQLILLQIYDVILSDHLLDETLQIQLHIALLLQLVPH